MEFKVTKIDKGLAIANFDETKAKLEESLKQYSNYLVTDENFLVAKSDRAALNNLSKEIENERKRVKKAIMEQYDTVFEPQCKEIVNMITSASAKIDEGIKAMEDRAREDKNKIIKGIWEKYDFKLVDLERVFKDTWLNKGTSEKTIQEEMEKSINQITSDLSVLETLNPKLKPKYLVNLDLAATVESYNREIEAEKRLNVVQSPKQNDIIDAIEYSIPTEVILSVDIKVSATETKLKGLRKLLQDNGYTMTQLTDIY